MIFTYTYFLQQGSSAQLLERNHGWRKTNFQGFLNNKAVVIVRNEKKNKTMAMLYFVRTPQQMAWGKEEAGEMHIPPDGETCTLPELYFLSVTRSLLCQETVLDYTAG